MNNKWMNATLVLTIVMISLISISSAAGPHAATDYYQGQCGVELSVPAPGLLANDIPNGKPLTVLTWTTPTTGTLTVNPNGSFVYTPPTNMPTGSYVTFYYTATDGSSVTNQALVKIAVTCKCAISAKNVNVCLGTAITPVFLISQGAGCLGCRDVTPSFDLSQIPAQPVAGQCYSYTVTCQGIGQATGQVCFGGSCTITSVPFTVCSSVTPSTSQIMTLGKVTCSCDTAPVISNIHILGDHWEYTITCQSTCGSATATGRVNIQTPCVPTSKAFTICSGVTPTVAMIQASGSVSCGTGVCDTTPAISNIHAVGDHWEYTITCTTTNGCISTATGIVNIQTPCVPTSKAFTVCTGVTPTVAMIQASGSVTCGTGVCDTTPAISNIHTVGDHWEYTITCTTTNGCISTATGIVNIQTPCVPTSKAFTICTGVTPTVAMIQASGSVTCGTGVCDATPAISNIHTVGDHWEYTITCTTTNGCISTATGIVNIQTPCVPTSKAFTVCTGVTPTVAMIQASGSVTCGTGVCDTTPAISNIHTVGDHWEYTITCTTTNGCISTATGIVNIQTPCVPTSKAFTICSGVTPTVAMIQASGSVTCGTGVCDTTPAITNIHTVGDHWEYTITCTTALGCSATATGIVKIGQSCVIDFTVFPIPPEDCPGNKLPTAEQIVDLGGVTCGCGDATPVISNIHWVSQPPAPEEWTGEYTITCTSADGCISSAIGQFNNADCARCICEPTSKPFTICNGLTPTVDLILANGAVSCGGVCDATPAISGIHIVGDHWEYTITCTSSLGCVATATGIVNVGPACVPTSKAFTICNGVTPTVAIIQASGSVSCGTGVCDTTPAITNIHSVGDHWEYTITCTTASGCISTATGIVNIGPACVPTSKAFTICSGVTPTVAMIQASGSVNCGIGVCDATPSITNIHSVGDHWEYTITCTTTSGCISAATGIVNIGPACVPTSKAFTICSGVTPTVAMIQASGSVSCGTGVCDTTPAISNIHTVGDHWEYTITCTTTSGCISTATGIVNIGPACVPTSKAFTICSGVTPTVAMIQASGSVNCGTGVCDATPSITNIHLVGDHWEYTITCTTTRGCISTATGIVNIQTPCVPTSKAFTICPGVTPTAQQILDSGVVSCGACDATPVISGIHKVADRWEYTITCTTALGCTAIGTGIVNIGQPCAIDFTVFPIPPEDCPGNKLPTAEQIVDLGGVTCGCGDATPKISNIHWVSQPPAQDEWTGEYTITCTSADGCISSAIGQFNNAGCAHCICEPTSKPFTICNGVTPTADLIQANGAVSCGGVCDATPAISGIHIVGDHWEYTITCTSSLGCVATATGIVNIGPVCTPTSEAFTICSGVTPTVAMIQANGAVSCGACDATPAISNIHTVGDHWEYTITCITASGCTATAIGRVNIETPCAPTSVAFTICKGVTPTAQQIQANGAVSCGACDAVPVISGIHIDGDRWVYTITCTTELGCTATGTGIVNIGQPCDISFFAFSLPPEYCPGDRLPTAEEIIELGVVSCGCDATPKITNIHWVSKPPAPDEWTGEYTITCTTADGCTASTTGQFTHVQCQVCSCAPTAPNLCGCRGFKFPMDLFISKGGGCHPVSGCDMTPTPVIDDSKVDYTKSGHSYPYTVKCPECTGNNVATGYIFIRAPLCGPSPNGGLSCTCPIECPAA